MYCILCVCLCVCEREGEERIWDEFRYDSGVYIRRKGEQFKLGVNNSSLFLYSASLLNLKENGIKIVHTRQVSIKELTQLA